MREEELLSFTPNQRILIVAGAVLFLLGLVQGGFVHAFANARMALSAHLTAVQSGMALMIAGYGWAAASLSGKAETLARWTLVSGMYGLWLGLTLSAATGASESLPIAGAGFSASQRVETTVSVTVLVSSLLMTVGWLIFVVGLARLKHR